MGVGGLIQSAHHPAREYTYTCSATALTAPVSSLEAAVGARHVDALLRLVDVHGALPEHEVWRVGVY